MNKHAPNGEKAQDSGVDLEQLSKVSTSGLEPWMNPDLTDKERFAEYKKFVDEKLEDIEAAYDRADDALKLVIENAPETKAYIREGQLLAEMDASTFSREQLRLSEGRLETIDGHQAVVGKITVNGQQLDTLLSDWSFYKTRPYQIAYAQKLGYRFATREENRAYVKGLLAKELNKIINHAEEKALDTYRKRWVRDDQGGLDVDFTSRVRTHDFPCDDDGALFVRASAESK